MGKLAAILNMPIKTVDLISMVTNGSFAGTSSWTTTGGTLLTASNVIWFPANSANDTLSQAKSVTSGRKYYFCGFIKSTSSSVAFRLSDSSTTTSLSHSGSNEFEFLSAVHTSAATSASGSLYIIDQRSSGWDYIYAKWFTMVDLTAEFGAGNEPTKETMDNIMSRQTNNWLSDSTTTTVTYY